MTILYTVGPDDRKRALKDLLRNELRLSAAQLRRLKAADGISVNGERAFVTRRLENGDRIELTLTEEAPDFPPEPGPLTILYEDEHLMAVDKPRGMIVHPTHSRFTGTLANRAWAHIRDAGGDGCHLVNRLDRDTGGVVLFAKNAWACSRMTGAVEGKRYLAVVCGVPETKTGNILFPIRRVSEADMKRICAEDGQSARTDWELLVTRDGLSLLSLRLYTGRTHQIRVHCAAMGWPVLGDRLYGTEASLARSQALGETMQDLWCSSLTFRHPVTGTAITADVRPSGGILSFFDFLS